MMLDLKRRAISTEKVGKLGEERERSKSAYLRGIRSSDGSSSEQ